jgi:betaine-aldehyde dehydrogenase
MGPDAQLVSEEKPGVRQLVNPATGEVVASVAEAGPADVDEAVRQARRAFEHGEWGRTAPRERADALEAIADLISEHAEELARLDCLNTGRPLSETQLDMPEVAGFFRFFARATVHLRGETVDLPGGVLGLTVREPKGVVGLIVPWNYPLPNASVKLAAALGAGNVCILKPSELTPLSALRLRELIEETTLLPAGVLNVVTGAGEIAGQAIVEHADVDGVSFTGGTSSGASVLRSAAGGLKAVLLELGGKSPNIVFPDADLERALESAIGGAFSAHGQNCVAASRLLLHEQIHDEFLEAFCKRARDIRLGNPLEAGTQMGPLVSEEQRARVEHYVDLGRSQGARLVLGGGRPRGAKFARGFFFEPTVFADVSPEMAIAQDEIFGPVVSVLEFSSPQEALALANSTRYGLAAAVWSRDLETAFDLARGIRAGMVWINDYNAFYPELPYGGYKQSGFGRELGFEGLEEYTVLKQITVKGSA